MFRDSNCAHCITCATLQNGKHSCAWDEWLSKHRDAWPSIERLLKIAERVLRKMQWAGDRDALISDVGLPVIIRILRQHDVSQSSIDAYAWRSLRYSFGCAISRLRKHQSLDHAHEIVTYDRGQTVADARIDARKLLMKCNERDRIILAMHFWQGKSYAEIGEAFGVKKSRVFVMVQEALTRARNA